MGPGNMKKDPISLMARTLSYFGFIYILVFLTWIVDIALLVAHDYNPAFLNQHILPVFMKLVVFYSFWIWACLTAVFLLIARWQGHYLKKECRFYLVAIGVFALFLVTGFLFIFPAGQSW